MEYARVEVQFVVEMSTFVGAALFESLFRFVVT